MPNKIKIGVDLLEITLRDGLYRWRGEYPRMVEDKSIVDLLTDTDPETGGVIISQPEKIFIWATSRDKGKLRIDRFQIAINDHVSAENAGTVYIVDRKENVTYWVDINKKTLTKTQGAKEGYRHTDKLMTGTGYMYIGEISDIINQFISKGFSIK